MHILLVYTCTGDRRREARPLCISLPLAPMGIAPITRIECDSTSRGTSYVAVLVLMKSYSLTAETLTRPDLTILSFPYTLLPSISMHYIQVIPVEATMQLRKWRPKLYSRIFIVFQYKHLNERGA